MSYTPPYQITNKALSLVADISEKVGNITGRTNLDSRPHLRKNNRIRSVHYSLAIEANSLSLDQVRDVINGRTVLGEQKEIQEVKNAYAAYDEIGNFDICSVSELKRLHSIMTRYIVEESGCFRKGEEGVFSGDTCIFMAPPARFVEGHIADLFQWMKENKSKVHPLILSAVFHYEFVFIHPFTDGNGRMARLWHTALLTEWNPLFEFIPLESRIERFQEGYYEAIARCHTEGSSTAFVEFMLEQISSVLSEISFADDLSRYVQRMLAIMEYDIPFTAKDIMDRLGLRSKETFRKNYLNPAIERKYVSMTIPDKPNSKNQRYIKL